MALAFFAAPQLKWPTLTVGILSQHRTNINRSRDAWMILQMAPLVLGLASHCDAAITRDRTHPLRMKIPPRSLRPHPPVSLRTKIQGQRVPPPAYPRHSPPPQTKILPLACQQKSPFQMKTAALRLQTENTCSRKQMLPPKMPSVMLLMMEPGVHFDSSLTPAAF